jgi:hypothetical protein
MDLAVGSDNEWAHPVSPEIKHIMPSRFFMDSRLA